MAKPIVLMGYPSDQEREEMEELTQRMKRELSDYHILVYQRRDLKVSMEVFNHENNGTKSVEEIKEYIEEQLNKI